VKNIKKNLVTKTQTAVQELLQGGVILHPTETCYGLAVDIFNKAAVTKLYNLKDMAFDKPVSILVRDLQEAEAYGVFNEKARDLAVKYWPGPLTLIVPRKAVVPKWVNFGMDSIGIRISSNKKAKELIEGFGGPLTTTSANIHTQPQAYTVQDVLDQGLVPDFIIDSGKIGPTLPSTILKVDGEEVVLIRQGPIQWPS
jgi:L-threonylcarbamoyladenylate synthase